MHIPGCRSALFLLLMAALMPGLIPATAIAGAHKTRLPPVEIPVDAAVRDGVIATLIETERRWNSQDFASLLALWDEFYEEARKNKQEVWQRKREQKQ